MTGAPLALPAAAAAMAAGGFVFGLGYFAVLRRCVAFLIARRSWHQSLALTALRLAGGAAFFFVAAKIGAASLLSATAGFFIARAIATRAPRKVP